MKKIAAMFIFAICLVICSYTIAVPLSSVKISDNGLIGRISHDGDTKIEGHDIQRRSFGSQDYSDFEDSDDETMVETESRFSGHPHNFGGYYPQNPHRNGPPGGVPPPFRKFNNFPDYQSDSTFNNHHGPPFGCHGRHCGNDFGHHHHHHHHPPGQHDNNCNSNEDEDISTAKPPSKGPPPRFSETTPTPSKGPPPRFSETTPTTTTTIISTEVSYDIDVRLGRAD